MKREKLYFKDEESETCCELSDHLFEAKYEELKEVELIEAIPDNETKGYVWCMEQCTSVSSLSAENHTAVITIL